MGVERLCPVSLQRKLRPAAQWCLNSPTISMVPLDGDEDIGEVACGHFGKATIPFGRVQNQGSRGRLEWDESKQQTGSSSMKAQNRSASRRCTKNFVRPGRRPQPSAEMPVVHPHAAGIDVG